MSSSRSVSASMTTLSILKSTSLSTVPLGTTASSAAIAATITSASRLAETVTQYATATVTVTAGDSTATKPSLHDVGWDFIHKYQGHITDTYYVYSYLWVIIFWSAVLLYVIAYQLGVSFGWVSVAYRKWAMRRLTVHFGFPHRQSNSNNTKKTRQRRFFQLPNNSVLLVSTTFVVVTLILSTAGPDYFPKSVKMFDFGSYGRLPQGPRPDDLPANIARRSDFKYVIWKSDWSQGNRFGYMVYTLMPIIVTMGLKSPFAIFSNRWFTHLSWDKVGTLHRAGGWFVWGLVTMHVIMWSHKLWTTHYDGQPIFWVAFVVWRYRCAWVAYISMTIAMATSLRWVRNKHYEFFYATHCVFMFLGISFGLAHHYMIGQFMGFALLLWGCDRLYRLIRLWYVNGNRGAIVEQQYNDEIRETVHSTYDVPSILKGTAHAQLLPSRTIRLTVRPCRKLYWDAGQNCLIWLPTVAPFRSHPFTIANHDENANEVVFIIKAREGTTLKLYNHIATEYSKSIHKGDVVIKPGEEIHAAPQVFLRVCLDGPMGSSGRVDWTKYSTVLLIAGGSGVTFPLAIGEYLSRIVPAGKGGSILRIRLIWVVREFVEITWAAAAFCRFQQALGDRLEVNIYVTKKVDNPHFDHFHHQHVATDHPDSILASEAIPKPHGPESIEEDESDDEDQRHNAHPGFSDFKDLEAGEDGEDDALSWTQFGGEQIYDNPNQNRLSRQLKQEGRKLRRLSRKASSKAATRRSAPGELPSPSYASDPMPPNAAEIASRLAQTIMSPPSQTPSLDDFTIKGSRRRPPVSLEQKLNVGNGATRLPPISVRRPSVDASSLQRDPWHGLGSSQPSQIYSPSFTAVNSSPPGTPKDALQRLDPGGISCRDNVSFGSRSRSLVLLEDTGDKEARFCDMCGTRGSENVWVDQADWVAAMALSEYARAGKRPDLERIITEEVEQCKGRSIVGTCGPSMLVDNVRQIVQDQINPTRVRDGDLRGDVTMFSEEFDM